MCVCVIWRLCAWGDECDMGDCVPGVMSVIWRLCAWGDECDMGDSVPGVMSVIWETVCLG